MAKKQDTIVVTGSAGFIGFHLSRKLLELGYSVVGIDNLNDYYDPKLKEYRNTILKKNGAYRFYKADIGDYKAIEKIFVKEKPRAVVHLAAQAGVRYSLVNPWIYAHSNYLGTLNVFEASVRAKVKRVVYASTSSAYGASTTMPFEETDPSNTPLSIYAATKRANELLAHSYHHVYGLETVGLRFFNVYGTHSRPDLALLLFSDAMMKGQAIQLFNKGKMSRDFTHVRDIVSGIISSIYAKELKNEIINLGNDTPISLLDFVEKLEKSLGKKAKRKLVPMAKGDIEKTWANITKAKRLLGYSPGTMIDQGIAEFTEWYMKERTWLSKLKKPKS